jgi:hypothetical protein
MVASESEGRRFIITGGYRLKNIKGVALLSGMAEAIRTSDKSGIAAKHLNEGRRRSGYMWTAPSGSCIFADSGFRDGDLRFVSSLPLPESYIEQSVIHSCYPPAT